MKKIGIVSYNIHCNFTNYGSALQSYALCKSVEKLGYKSYLINYCPDCLKDANPLNPFKKMWDKDKKTILMVKKMLPLIKINNTKFNKFYKTHFNLTKLYTSKNFKATKKIVDSYICGSDTIFCKEEFGFDNGYFANYECMKHKSIAYAASYGDTQLNERDYTKLKPLLKNFKCISLREKKYVKLVNKITNRKVYKTIDPTLLLNKEEYLKIAKPVKRINKKDNYILLYSRRFDSNMNEFAKKLAIKKKYKIVEISLNPNCLGKNHINKYDAGVEEFISLVNNAKHIVTNSYHGMLFSLIFEKPFNIFAREQAYSKISEVLKDNKINISNDNYSRPLNYKKITTIINTNKIKSLNYLKLALDNLYA